jgi:hypothetical protein
LKLAEQKRAQEIRAAKQKEWQASHTAALIQATMDTALATMKGYSQTGPIGGSVLAVIMAALGAAQIAMIASQKMPEFARGGILQGPSHEQGGVSTNVGVMEGGEGVINKSSMKNPVLRKLASDINVMGGGVSFAQVSKNSQISSPQLGLSIQDIQMMFAEYSKIPVVVATKDINVAQRKISTIDSRSKI